MTTRNASGSDGRAPAVSWAPDEACRLPTAERPLREAEFAALFAEAVRSSERLDPTRLRFALDATAHVAARVAELAVRETDCCEFFTFTLTAANGRLDLDVTVPRGRAAVLDGLAEQTAPAR